MQLSGTWLAGRGTQSSAGTGRARRPATDLYRAVPVLAAAAAPLACSLHGEAGALSHEPASTVLLPRRKGWDASA